MTVVSFDTPYYDGPASSGGGGGGGGGGGTSTVPPAYPFEVSIAGRNYIVDTSFEPYRRDAFRHRSIPPQRESIDLNNEPGEGTINTAGLWRRGMEDWSLGAGQIFLDRKQSVANRFFRSKGVNPWTQWQLTLLQDTKQVFDPSNTGVFPQSTDGFIRAIAVSNTVYVLTRFQLFWTTDWNLPMNSVEAPAPAEYTDIATDGFNVYVSDAFAGILMTASNTTSMSNIVGPYNGNGYSSVGYCNDRLLCSQGPNLFDITHLSATCTLTIPVDTGNTITGINVTPLPQAVNGPGVDTVGNSTPGDNIIVGNESFTASDDAAQGAITIFTETQVATTDNPIGTAVVDSEWSDPDAPFFTHNNPSWIWDCYAGGSSEIYIGGHSSLGGFSESVNGGASGIYRTTLDSDGTTLTAPSIALPLEGGEFCTCLASYLNFIFVGSNYGIRMCQTLAAYDPTGNQGDLRAGALIPNITQPVNVPVYGAVGSGRFVWFSWGNYDSTSTGIGRMDLTNFIDALAPAYASDLMVEGTGQVFLDWDPITNGPLLALQGNPGIDIGGIFVQDPAKKVMSGTVESGQITYGLPDAKVAMSLDARVITPFVGSIEGLMAIDQGLGQNYTEVGSTNETQPLAQWALNQLRGEMFQVEIQMNSGGSNGTPELSRWTLKAYPGVSTGISISAVLYLATLDEEKGLLQPYDPYAEYAYLENLRQTQQVIQYVEGPFVANVVIQQLDWLPNLEQVNGPRAGYQGNLIVYMNTLPN